MSNDQLSIRLQSAPWSRAYELIVFSGDLMLTDKGGILLANKDRKYQYESCPDNPNLFYPTFSIDSNGAQTLMDDLWAAGIRPTEGQGSAGSLAATQEHLQDLQKLVFADYRTKPATTLNPGKTDG